MIEDYVPGGWSPIIAQQDTLSTTQRFSDRTWKQGSIRGDMIFAVVDTGNSNTYTHSYYIRPET